MNRSCFTEQNYQRTIKPGINNTMKSKIKHVLRTQVFRYGKSIVFRYEMYESICYAPFGAFQNNRKKDAEFRKTEYYITQKGVNMINSI